jgi:hypothetical protein
LIGCAGLHRIFEHSEPAEVRQSPKIALSAAA